MMAPMDFTTAGDVIARLESGPQELRWRGKIFATKKFHVGDVGTTNSGVWIATSAPTGEPGTTGSGWVLLLGAEKPYGL